MALGDIRRAVAADASCLSALSIEVWFSTYIKKGITPIFADYALKAYSTEAYLALLKDVNQTVLVSENIDGIDGLLRLSKNSPTDVVGCSDVEIASLYVQPRHHGKAIGQRLLRAGLKAMHEGGVEAVWLNVNAENLRALAFYEAFGFAKKGDTFFKLGGGEYLNHTLAIETSMFI